MADSSGMRDRGLDQAGRASAMASLSIPGTRHYRIPRGMLGQFVDMLWLYDGYTAPHARERLLPMSTTELVIDLRDGSTASRATLVGPHSRYWVLDTSEQRAVIGVHFKIAGAFPFFGVPADELHNVRTSLEALWGPAAAVIVEQVLAAPTPDAKFDILEAALIRRARTFGRHAAVTFAMNRLSAVPPPAGVAAVMSSVGMCERRFRDRFRSEVGMPPKLFARVQRFQAVIGAVHTVRDVDWAHVAADCGYFDQAHFIHDFRAFSGFTPTEYFDLKNEHHNHVPLPD
jgi:AraC-like DNA-binding protein